MKNHLISLLFFSYIICRWKIRANGCERRMEVSRRRKNKWKVKGHRRERKRETLYYIERYTAAERSAAAAATR